MIPVDLKSIEYRHQFVDKDKRFTDKIAHHDRGVLLAIIEKIGDAVSLEIGVDCTVEEFCKAIKQYQLDSIKLEWKEDA